MANRPVAEDDRSSDWLSIEQAVQLCLELGLTRTSKTIRRWASRSNGLPADQAEIQVMKKDTSYGFRYLIERSSLDRKIEQELALETSEQRRTGAHASSHVQRNTPVQPNEITSEDQIEEAGGVKNLENENNQLREQNTSLEIDKQVRDRMLEQLKEDRALLFSQMELHVKTISAQAQKIGGLETRLELGVPSASEAEIETDAVAQDRQSTSFIQAESMQGSPQDRAQGADPEVPQSDSV